MLARPWRHESAAGPGPAGEGEPGARRAAGPWHWHPLHSLGTESGGLSESPDAAAGPGGIMIHWQAWPGLGAGPPMTRMTRHDPRHPLARIVSVALALAT